MTTNLNNCNVEMQSLTFVHTTLCQLYSVVVHPPKTYRCQIVSPCGVKSEGLKGPTCFL